MTVYVAESAGFCFGVKRAVDEVFRLASERSHPCIYTVGDLIHNPLVIADLAAKGVSSIDETMLDELAEKTNADLPCIVVIRTHGVTESVSRHLTELNQKNRYFTVCDMTCPYVKKIHRLVAEHPERQLIVFGDAGHPEVKGIVSYAGGGVIITDNPSDDRIAKLPDAPTLVVAQTTQNTEKWRAFQAYVKCHFPDCLIYDTICHVTGKRQTETAELAHKVDRMIVIGGRGSSNTAKLYDTAKAILPATYFIERVEELNSISFTPFTKVGITAGASTPGSLIQEVVTYMSELTTKKTGTDESIGNENFADLLEQSLKSLTPGETVTGIITSVSSGEIHVDLNAKETGIITRDEVTEDASVELTEAFKPGDSIEVYVIKVSDRDGVATLSKKRIDSKLHWKNVMEAYNNNAIVEGKVIEAIKGGVLLNFDGYRLFVPASQTGVPKSGDMKALVGTVQRARIIEVNEGRRRAVASIRKVKNEERKEKEAEFWANIEIGKWYEGEVKSMTSYGAFVDLGGVDGMVHSSELSWSHIKSPADVVSVGQTLRVYIKDFNPETKRISLGYKTEDTNPWKVFTEKFAVGDVAEVKVVSLLPFGAFAEVVPGADGLIHISQITDHKIGNPSEVLSVGDVVSAEIISINEENHQIGLSIRSLMEKENMADADEPDADEPDAE